MGKRKFELKRYDYLNENKSLFELKNILNSINTKAWDEYNYTWTVNTWHPTIITTTNVPTISSTVGEETARYYNRPNTLFYMDFSGTSNTANNTISVSMDNGWRML